MIDRARPGYWGALAGDRQRTAGPFVAGNRRRESEVQHAHDRYVPTHGVEGTGANCTRWERARLAQRSAPRYPRPGEHSFQWQRAGVARRVAPGLRPARGDGAPGVVGALL